MFGINGSELIVLALVAAVVLGPEKLPEYTRKLAQMVKRLRGFADTAKDRLREEAGDEIADLDWKKLDPRQYDPRKIIRDALLEDDEPHPSPSTASDGDSPAPIDLTKTSTPDDDRLPEGTPAPFDDEAT